MMCKDHYTISVAPKIMERLINRLIDAARCFPNQQARKKKHKNTQPDTGFAQVSSPLCKTYPFRSTRQEVSWRVSIQTSKPVNVYVSSVTALHGCQYVFGVTWSCWVFTVLHRSLWVRLWNQGFERGRDSHCHLDMEADKPVLPSGEDGGNFWRFAF